jgi:hypothetical protein
LCSSGVGLGRGDIISEVSITGLRIHVFLILYRSDWYPR